MLVHQHTDNNLDQLDLLHHTDPLYLPKLITVKFSVTFQVISSIFLRCIRCVFAVSLSWHYIIIPNYIFSTVLSTITTFHLLFFSFFCESCFLFRLKNWLIGSQKKKKEGEGKWFDVEENKVSKVWNYCRFYCKPSVVVLQIASDNRNYSWNTYWL